MKWHSIGEFIAMGGYGFYIWASYAVAAALITLEIILVIRRHRTARRNLGEAEPDAGSQRL